MTTPAPSDKSINNAGKHDQKVPAKSPQTSWEKHDQFYFEDGSVTFLIEKTLYRLHKSLLITDSSVFAEILALPSGTGDDPKGTSNQNPIRLNQNKSDFDCFLSFYYARGAFKTGLASSSDLITYIRVADKFGFVSQKMAGLIALEDKGTSAAKLRMGRKYPEAKCWIAPSITNLVVECIRNDKPLTRAQALLLDPSDVLRIWHIVNVLQKYQVDGRNCYITNKGISKKFRRAVTELINDGRGTIDATGQIFDFLLTKVEDGNRSA